MFTTMPITKNIYNELDSLRRDKQAWSKLFYEFSSNDKRYIVLHGCEDGILSVPYRGYLTGDQFYEYITKYLNLCKYGEKINIICCFGGRVKRTTKKYRKLINFVNDTNVEGNLSIANKNGNYEIAIYDKTLVNKIKGFFYNALNS